jgi:nucleoside-diphosphate-sugar epimerase
MKVFVTGATGYIGGSVADGLVASGHRVVGLVRSTESAKARDVFVDLVLPFCDLR